MDSKIRVEFDFDNKDPYLQITLGQSEDLRDQMLKHFVQTISLKSKEKHLVLRYPENNVDNSVVKIIIEEKGQDYVIGIIDELRQLFYSMADKSKGHWTEFNEVQDFFSKWEKRFLEPFPCEKTGSDNNSK